MLNKLIWVRPISSKKNSSWSNGVSYFLVRRQKQGHSHTNHNVEDQSIFFLWTYPNRSFFNKFFSLFLISYNFIVRISKAIFLKEAVNGLHDVIIDLDLISGALFRHKTNGCLIAWGTLHTFFGGITLLLLIVFAVCVWIALLSAVEVGKLVLVATIRILVGVVAFTWAWKARDCFTDGGL